MGELKEANSWCIYDEKVKYKLSGEGIDSLKDNLDDDACLFAVLRINAKGLGNTGKDQDNFQNIILTWKGPDTSGMKRTKFNQNLNEALEKIEPNNGYVECLGKIALTHDNVVARIHLDLVLKLLKLM